MGRLVSSAMDQQDQFNAWLPVRCGLKLGGCNRALVVTTGVGLFAGHACLPALSFVELEKNAVIIART